MNDLKQKDKLEKECTALRQAHMAQQALVMNLQETVQKSQKFKSVIVKQEQIISKLESQLSSPRSLSISNFAATQQLFEKPASIAIPPVVPPIEQPPPQPEQQQVQQQQAQQQQTNNTIPEDLYKLIIKENQMHRQQLKDREVPPQSVIIFN